MASDRLLRSMTNGLIRAIVLSILEKGSLSGYLLMKEIKRMTGIAYHAGVLYPMLYSMEETGLISGEWVTKGRRRIKQYQLTGKGASALAKLRAFLKGTLHEILKEGSRDISA
ncbi:MAG: PadR family transcriptional regulator [Candidatus Methanosuratincola petrocarbonis]